MEDLMTLDFGPVSVSASSDDALFTPSKFSALSTEHAVGLLGVEDADPVANGDSDTEDEGVKRWVINPPPKPHKISEKKRADNVAFEHWLEENQEQLSAATDKASPADNVRSLAHLAKTLENRRIIASPREYQLELFDRAKKQNTIAVLDTGSGKTLIAALLLRWIIENELEDRAKGEAKRIAFFLVDKVALVFQQHAVLSCNLDHPIEKLCGEMIDSVNSKEFWAEKIDQNMVIVCTAEILLQCLHHSYVQMDQINLLIFDEAHHAKKNHPFARIIKDFYILRKDAERRPRILGMTASPVDSIGDPLRAAMELEGILDSQIATTADPLAVKNSMTEITKMYAPLKRPFETELHKSLTALLGGNGLFAKAFLTAKDMAAHLGPWCADRFWKLYFRAEDIHKLEAATERTLLREHTINRVLDARIQEVRDGRDIVDQYRLPQPALDYSLVTDKVMTLVNILKEQFDVANGKARCIVFVQQRNTAVLLVDLLQQPAMRIPGLEVGILVGGGRTEAGYGEKVSYRDQVTTLLKFRRGELNCLFATSVAEEGLDIPDCNVIVRFDIGSTLIQYIQSRGRARQDNSIYIHMMETGNGAHRRRVNDNERQEKKMRDFCTSLPEDRKLTDNIFNVDYLLRKERNQRSHIVPSTGAKLTFKQSLVCLATFVASLPHAAEISLTPDYVVSAVPGGFECEVMLPGNAPIKSATGAVHSSKGVAKCSAAFEMCLQLLERKLLNDHLHPAFTKQLPAMRNARLAISSRKKSEYDMRTKPEIWSRLGDPTELYALALTLSMPEALGRTSSPLLLLSREPMPEPASFPIFFGADRSSNVRCTSLPGRLMVDGAMAASLAAFTLKIFRDVFSKEYDATAAQLPYFLAPTIKGHGFNFSETADVLDVVNRQLLDLIRQTDKIECNFTEEDSFFAERYVTDPWDGSRKFYLRRRRCDLKPQDPVPEDIVAPKHRAWRTCKDKNILNYSVSLWSKARSYFNWREDQPVVEAELLSVRRNLLDDNIGPEEQPKKCYLVLEPLSISPLPVDVVAMAYNFPAIIHRIDSVLIALDACKLFQLDIRPDLALEALTKDSDNTEEHDVEQINFQGGMGNNYERLEFLGDSFLKMATTISIYSAMPDNDEFESHVERMLLICNKNLFNNALEIGLEEYVRSKSFNRRGWYPEGLILKRGKPTPAGARHVLADKSVADVCEALIGAAYLTNRAHDGTNRGFDMAVRAVTAVVRDKKHRATQYDDYYATYSKPTWQTTPATTTQLEMARRSADRMGYVFTHPRLLRAAFMHPSAAVWRAAERLPSYQRLEFLGDALLDMAAVDFLFHRFPGADPQWLTEHKMAMVSNQFLGCLAVDLGFHRALTHESAPMAKEILSYVGEITAALEAARAAVRGGGNDYARDYWAQCAQPPKCLPDVVEAYLGAVFVDSGYDYATVQSFFDARVRPYFEDMALYDAFANKHPVTWLATRMQNEFRCTEWRVLAKPLAPLAEATAADGTELGGRAARLEGGEGGGGDGGETAAGGGAAAQIVCAVLVHGNVVAVSQSASARYGKLAAAKKALALLEGVSREEFRAQYRCSCVIKDDAAAVAQGGALVLEEHGSAI